MDIYNIPSEIKIQLTLKFLTDFRNKTVEIFKENDSKQSEQPANNENETSRRWWVELYDTCGMHDAMEWSLKENNLIEVLNYFKGLDLDDADSFNEEVTLMLFQKGMIGEENLMNLIIYKNEHFEEEAALFDLDKNEVLLKGDYYHDKIIYLIKGYLMALNIDEDNIAVEWINNTHELFKKLEFYED